MVLEIEEGDVYSLAAAAQKANKRHYPDPAPFQLPDPRQPARSLTNLLKARAVILGRRRPRNAPPLHTAQAVHEVASTAALPTGDWLTTVIAGASLPGFSQACPCVLPLALSETAHSPWSPRQVSSGVLLGSFRGWFGSASCCPGLAEAKAALVRSASFDACPTALPALLSLASFQDVRIWELPFGNLFLISVWTCRHT